MFMNIKPFYMMIATKSPEERLKVECKLEIIGCLDNGKLYINLLVNL